MPDTPLDSDRERLQRIFTIVRPAAVKALGDAGSSSSSGSGSTDAVPEEVTATNGKHVVLVPMSEWLQCLQRAVRTFMQTFVFMIGGGTVYTILTGLGIPPASAENLPSTGYPLYDAILYSLVLSVVVFLWNAAEFVLDIDIKAPRWRA